MKANELRVGNFVFEPLNENKKAFKVFEIYHEEDYDKINYHNALSFEPVRLTDDWLLGFELVKTKNGSFLMGCYELFKDQDCYRIELIKCELSITIKYIEFVHELQNFYHILSGEELQLSST